MGMIRRNWTIWLTLVGVCAVVLMAPGTALASRPNSECLACHGESSMVSNALFNVGSVDKSLACGKCHLDSLVGTHPNQTGPSPWLAT